MDLVGVEYYMVEPLDFTEARHLVARAGLGTRWSDINKLVGRSRAEAVEYILTSHSPKTSPPPKMTSWQVHQRMRERSGQTRMMSHRKMRQEGDALKQWWIGQMLKSRSPITEKLTLFWHSHFTSSFDKVEQADLLYRQNQLLRRHSMGNFGAMLKAIIQDPAMSIYLDCDLNEKSKPNENFARELMELFTLGGRYHSEKDVQQVARIFTGWTVDRVKATRVFNRNDHDYGVRTVLNKKAKTTDDVVRILLEHKRTSLHIAEKFWKFFVSDQNPDYRYINQWAASFRRSNYEIKVLLREVLNSDAFWSKRYRATVTKSPADLIVGTMRSLPYPRLSNRELAGVFRLLGQDLFDPPNVKGWAGGYNWINTQTMLVRTSLLTKLTRGSLNARVNRGHRFPNADDVKLKEWVLAAEPIRPLPTTRGKVRLIRALVLDPAYQLT